MRSAKWIMVVLGLAGGCTFPATRMEPVADYGSGHTTVSSQPARTAGPSYTNTTSPDGATLFVCEYGSTKPGNRVPPHTTPPC
jgi:hypothetical protein